MRPPRFGTGPLMLLVAASALAAALVAQHFRAARREFDLRSELVRLTPSPEWGGDGKLALVGDSDSHLVKGFVALMVALYSGKSPEQAAKLDGLDLLKQLNFGAHVTSKRSNGVRAMVEKIQRDAIRVS